VLEGGGVGDLHTDEVVGQPELAAQLGDLVHRGQSLLERLNGGQVLGRPLPAW
jgi:hypothetical protein